MYDEDQKIDGQDGQRQNQTEFLEHFSVHR
jgi:hypothetical protein